VPASCSASSSQAFARRITSSRAGTPFGKSVCRSASRLTEPRPLPLSEEVELLRLRPRVACCWLVWATALLRAEPPFREPLRARVRCARFEAPATPCARLRCAPKDAARLKVVPHSGHTNVPSSLTALVSLLVLVVAALRVLAILGSLPFRVGGRISDNNCGAAA
jgi:hypothetical protein